MKKISGILVALLFIATLSVSANNNSNSNKVSKIADKNNAAKVLKEYENSWEFKGFINNVSYVTEVMSERGFDLEVSKVMVYSKEGINHMLVVSENSEVHSMVTNGCNSYVNPPGFPSLRCGCGQPFATGTAFDINGDGVCDQETECDLACHNPGPGAAPAKK